MAKTMDWLNKDVNLKGLSEDVYRFFRDDKFHEIKIDSDPHGTWYEIQAKKMGAWRSVASQRKAVHVIIKGEPNKFSVRLATGEWGKNLAVASLVTGGIGFIGLGLNARFQNKLWNFIKNSVESRQGQAKKSDDELEDPITILKKRLARGEISKVEFDELKSSLE